MKVTVVGAGNVGATCANVLATREVANEVVLLDIKDGFAEGKALDIWETSPINLYDTRTVGSTNDYTKTANSDVVVITSGIPRKPGMSRDDLIATNAGIVKSVTSQIMENSPNAILVIVSNPLDVMTYCAYLNAGVDSKRVLGMAGILDTARYRSFLAEALNVSPRISKRYLWVVTVILWFHFHVTLLLVVYLLLSLSMRKLLILSLSAPRRVVVKLLTFLALPHGTLRELQQLKWLKPLLRISVVYFLVVFG